MLSSFICEFIFIRLWRCLFPMKEATWPLQVGDDVRACFRGGGNWSSNGVSWPLAKVTCVNDDGTYDVMCDDAAEEVEGALSSVLLKDIRTVGMQEIFMPASARKVASAPQGASPRVAPLPFAAAQASAWTQRTDPASGRVYYVNDATHETSWVPPPDAAAPAPAMPQPAMQVRTPPPPRPAAGAGGAWIAQVDPASGRTYYTNRETGESSWEAPPETRAVAAAAPAGPPARPRAVPPQPRRSPWIARVDNKSGETYYENSETGETTWDAPADAATPAAPAAAPTPSRRTAASQPKLQSAWSSQTDPRSGRTYYQNATTGETSWDPPTDAATAPAEPTPSRRMAASQPKLQSAWSSQTDPRSGRTYYQNATTGETSWDPPADAAEPTPSRRRM